MTVRAAIYARVSTEDQAVRGYSIPDQLMKLRLYCKNRDMEIVEEYVDDGYSGRNVSRRPAYRKMMSRDEMYRWDVVVVLKMDRIHRNAKNFMEMMDQLRKHDKDFLSVMDQINTSNAMGRFVMDTMQRIAQLESEQIGERTKMGMRQKALKDDGIMGFSPPFGYGIDDGKLIVNDEELPIVRNIFEMYMSGMTLDDIADNLNDNSVTTRRMNVWNKFNLRNILHNPVYAGYMRWDDLLRKHDAGNAVSVDEYNDVQLMMASKVRDPRKRNPVLIEC